MVQIENESEYQEKQTLVESMIKLIDHIHENKLQQQEIFKSLSQNDLHKIIKNLRDSNQNLRKVSAKFLAELLYDNIELQIQFCEYNKILPFPGKICINGFPNVNDITNQAQILYQLKSNKNPQQPLICWYISDENINKNDFTLNYIQNGISLNHLDFIDPLYNLFGFIIREDALSIIKENQIPLKNTKQSKQSNLIQSESSNLKKNRSLSPNSAANQQKAEYSYQRLLQFNNLSKFRSIGEQNTQKLDKSALMKSVGSPSNKKTDFELIKQYNKLVQNEQSHMMKSMRVESKSNKRNDQIYKSLDQKKFQQTSQNYQTVNLQYLHNYILLHRCIKISNAFLGKQIA